MIDIVQGKSMMKDTVGRYAELEKEHPDFVSERKLSEQDIATKKSYADTAMPMRMRLV